MSDELKLNESDQEGWPNIGYHLDDKNNEYLDEIKADNKNNDIFVERHKYNGYELKLIIAAEEGVTNKFIEIAIPLLDQKPEIFSSQATQQAILVSAIYNYTTILDYLIKHGLVEDKEDNNKVKIWAKQLLENAKNNNVNVLKQQLLHPIFGLNINKNLVNQLLMIAIKHDAIDVVILLLENGWADVNAVCTAHLTPLMAAVCSGNLDLVKLLVARGANLELRDGEGRTALALAVLVDDKIIVEFLLFKGANVYDQQWYNLSAPQKGAYTPMDDDHYGAWLPLDQLKNNVLRSIVDPLGFRNYRHFFPNPANWKGYPVLINAIKGGNSTIVEQVIKKILQTNPQPNFEIEILQLIELIPSLNEEAFYKILIALKTHSLPFNNLKFLNYISDYSINFCQEKYETQKLKNAVSIIIYVDTFNNFDKHLDLLNKMLEKSDSSVELNATESQDLQNIIHDLKTEFATFTNSRKAQNDKTLFVTSCYKIIKTKKREGELLEKHLLLILTIVLIPLVIVSFISRVITGKYWLGNDNYDKLLSELEQMVKEFDQAANKVPNDLLNKVLTEFNKGNKGVNDASNLLNNNNWPGSSQHNIIVESQNEQTKLEKDTGDNNKIEGDQTTKLENNQSFTNR